MIKSCRTEYVIWGYFSRTDEFLPDSVKTYFLKTDILCKLIENVNFTKFYSIFMAGLI